MDCGNRDLSLNLQCVSPNSNPSPMTPRTRACKVEQDITALFLDLTSKMTPANESYKKVSSIKSIKLENFNTGVFKFKDALERVFACGRIPTEEAKKLETCNPNEKQEWDNLIAKAFKTLSKYFQADQLLNFFVQGHPYCDRIVKNYANPNAAMQKLIEVCKVKDLFATESNIVCVHMDNIQNMTPELLAKCMMTDEEYSFFECGRLLEEFDQICHFTTKSNEPPYGEIGILVRTNPDKAKTLIAAIISKFKDPASQIKTALSIRYGGLPILSEIIKYFEDASTLQSITIDAVCCNFEPVP